MGCAGDCQKIMLSKAAVRVKENKGVNAPVDAYILAKQHDPWLKPSWLTLYVLCKYKFSITH